MGAQWQSECFASDLAAATSMCASEFPKTVPNGAGGVNTVSCVVTDASHLSVSTNDGTATTTASMPVSFTACDPMEHYTDLGLMFTAGTLALVVVWCAKSFVLKLVTNQ